MYARGARDDDDGGAPASRRWGAPRPGDIVGDRAGGSLGFVVSELRSEGLSGSGYGRRVHRVSGERRGTRRSRDELHVPAHPVRIAARPRLLHHSAPTGVALAVAVVRGGAAAAAAELAAASDGALASEAKAQMDDERRVDMLLLLAKCAVPASFVLASGGLAVTFNQQMDYPFKKATEELAGGALIVTFAFELTKGYTLHAADGSVSLRLVICSFVGTLLSGQLQAWAQRMWPWGPQPSAPGLSMPARHVREGVEGLAHEAAGASAGAAALSWTDSIPFMIAFFVDGVVLAYDTPPPPAEQRGDETPCYFSDDDSEDEEAPPAPPAGAKLGRAKHAAAAGAERRSPKSPGSGHSRRRSRPSCLARAWRRVRPAMSVLTLVVSIDNIVDGIGMYQKLDTSVIPVWGYYATFAAMVYAGAIVTAFVRRVPSEGVQAAWYAFGAFSILDGGMELATGGLTTWVLLGFTAVWGVLMLG